MAQRKNTESHPSAKPRGRPAGQRDTRARLVTAAMEEFCQSGFNGTDTNRIAQRAGFAPQTFYRWFRDKPAVFVAAYQDWETLEWELLDALDARSASPEEVVDTIIRHHQQYRQFRRSLRYLAVEDPTVRQARADSRRRQIERIRALRHLAADQTERIFIALLEIERLADAIAEEEPGDMGFSEAALRERLMMLVGDELGG